MNTLRLKNMKIFAYHGVNNYEKKFGAEFQIDLELTYNNNKSFISDKLKDVINYEEVYVDVEYCVKENKYNLIEALAEKILNVIMLKYTVVETSIVRVRKPFAPIKGIFDNIEFEIAKKRSDYE